MPRIACAFLPRFELTLLARREGPGLWRRPAVVADPSASPALVREATPAAEEAGVRPGMTVDQARVRCGGLVLYPPDPEAKRAAEAEVLAALARLAPQLASDGRGAFFLGLAGMERLIRDERVYAARVEAALRPLGFTASVGIAGHPFAAWVAARRGVGPVAPSGDARLLASVPLAELDLSEPARTLLALLGVTTAGQVARLPHGALGRRLGPEGARLDRLCRGELFPPGTVPTAALVPRDPIAVGLDMESPADALEPLLFLVKGLLGGLLARVAAERKALAELTVEAELEDADHSCLVHRLGPAEPTLDARQLVDLVRLWLEGEPFAAPLRSIRVVASKVAPAATRQLRLYARREDAGEAALERAVARLEAAFGAGTVVHPGLAPRFLPERRVAWVPAAGAPGGTLRRAVVPPAAAAPWALRLLAVPEPVELAGGGGAPRVLVRRGQPPRRVLRIEAAQRVSGEWWAAPFDRSYAWVVCEGGERFWLFHDHLCSGTFLHAVAD